MSTEFLFPGGAVEVEEFLLGCLRLRGQARAMDMAKLMYDQSWLVKSTGRFQLFVEEQLRALKSEASLTQRVGSWVSTRSSVGLKTNMLKHA